ncbi:MAG TPA: HAMP domain-containing sensor histidine kinase [Candidatus Nitrosopolaris sp.]|nr:HAMP domain-containing sensor histidine kinase [Candidatus Nitrosopolaris sp.]
MPVVLAVMPLAIEVAFVLLSVATVADWLTHRERRRGYLALAFGSLTLLVLLAPSLSQSGPLGELLTGAGIVLFLLSGWALLLFRDSFIPLATGTKRFVAVVIVLVAAIAIFVQLPTDTGLPHAPLQTFALAALLTTWSICVVEPIVTLWLASRGRPAVEGARMRALSLGYAGLVAVIMFGTLGGSLVRNAAAELTLDLVSLAIVPMLFFSFLPPTWLRRMWSQPEEEELRQGLHSLLTFSPDRATQARRALEWATRLVGAAGAVIVDSDSSILASQALSEKEAKQVAADAAADSEGGVVRSPRLGPTTLVIPLDFQRGPGAMVIVAGPFTPLFGDDEVTRLRQYASSITAGLDRVALTARINDLEKAKTEFMNIASHELRGPMTVIKGYLTMLEAGSLGILAPKAMSVMPLLIAKADEVNAMIEQMLEAARLEEGHLVLHKEPGDIVELTELAIDDMRPVLADRQLDIDAPAIPLHADVDSERFQIVVRNLISNAMKYSPEEAPIKVVVNRNGGTATVMVIDRGVGIAPEDQPRLFTKFGRIERGSTMHVAGTGLGLWLSREIARLHGGDITCESVEGSGSTFTFEVPIIP